METKHTPGPWTVEVRAASVGLEETDYCHLVKKGIHEYSVACTTQKNFEHIVHKDLPNGYVESSGVGRIAHDLTPHPDAILIAAAPDLLSALNGLLQMYVAFINSGDAGNWNPEDESQVKAARAAIAKALGK